MRSEWQDRNFLERCATSAVEWLYLLLSCTVFCSRRSMREPAVIAVVLTVAYYVCIAGGPMGYSRYRHPVMPIICVLSAYGLSLIQAHLANPRVSSFAHRGVEARV